MNVLKGQSGSVQCLCWNSEIGWLFSGKIDINIQAHSESPHVINQKIVMRFPKALTSGARMVRVMFQKF